MDVPRWQSPCCCIWEAPSSLLYGSVLPNQTYSQSSATPTLPGVDPRQLCANELFGPLRASHPQRYVSSLGREQHLEGEENGQHSLSETTKLTGFSAHSAPPGKTSS